MTLQPGWNLITFQVLPDQRSPAAVFAALKSETGNKPLYNSAAPASSNVVAAYELSAVQSGLGGSMEFQWRGFRAAGIDKLSEVPRIQPSDSHVATGGEITALEFGQAYFVFVTAILSDSRYRIEGSPAPGSTRVEFQPDWNLIGVPLQAEESDEPINRMPIGSVFRPGDLANVKRILRWDGSSQQFRTYKVGEADQSEFQLLDAQAGYWVEVKAAFALEPELVVQAPADSDLPPLADAPPAQVGKLWSPGPEDVEIGLPGEPPIFDDASTQRLLRIDTHQTSLDLPFYNKGGGVLGWRAELLPYLGAHASPAVALATPDQVALALSLPRARGLALASTEVLKIAVDRSRLPPGTYLARLKVSASTGQERSFDVVLQAAGLEGQWVGKVVIETVNGRRNAIADIDLNIQLTQDDLPGSRQLRGIVDSRETLLWPEDAQLLGHFLDFAPGGGIPVDFAHRFVLEGGLTFEPGDINQFPFDSFPLSSTNPGDDLRTETDAVSGLRYATNREGDRHYSTLPGRRLRAKFTNPLPTFLSRDLQLIGALAGTESGMPVLAGDYVELVRGLLPQPIELRGKFRLIRRSFPPYRPASYFHDTPEGGVSRSANTPYAAEIAVDRDLLIDRILVVVAQDATDRRHSLRLTAPDGTETVLHEHEAAGAVGGVIFDSSKVPLDALAVLEPPELRGAAPLPSAGVAGLNTGKYEHLLRESLASYVVRAPRQSFSSLIGKNAKGTWTLRWEHSEAGNVNHFKGWSLLVYGTPIHTLAGKVVIEGDNSPDRFNDVRLDVVGLNANVAAPFTHFDRATGQFTIANVPGLRLNVLATKPGYPQAGLDQLDVPSHPRGFVDHLEGFLAGSPGSNDLTVVLRPSSAPPRVSVSRRAARAPILDGLVTVPAVTLALEGTLAAGAQLGWDTLWDGDSATAPGPAVTGSGRRLTTDLQLPAVRFTVANNFSVAIKPRVAVDGTWIAFDDWIVVTLDQGSAEPRHRLLQLYSLNGFGAEIPYTGAADPTGALALQAQKTMSAKVDVDRPPYIGAAADPTLNFDEDGLEGEDIDLHPRSFAVKPASGDSYAYAEILPTPDTRFTELKPPSSGTIPAYNDDEHGIAGRNINEPGEPVVVFSAIGGQLVNLGAPGTDGKRRVSVGANPGPSRRP
jgi:hypothetical protein